MPDVSREVLQAELSQPWLKRALRARIKRWVGTNNAEAREEWVARKLRELPAGSRLLDAGAGERQYEGCCGHLKYVSQDFGKYNGVGDGSGLQMGAWDNSRTDIICDITQIPEPDGSFDAIMCIEVLEHLEAPIEALREFRRLLRSVFDRFGFGSQFLPAARASSRAGAGVGRFLYHRAPQQ